MQHALDELVRSPHRSVLGHFFNHAPVGISLGIDSKIAYANQECARMWGYENPRELCGKSFFDFIAPEMHPFVIQLWHSRGDASADDPWSYDLTGVRPDGSRFPYRCTSIPVTVSQGKGTFAFFVDLSQLRHAEEELRLHREHLEMLLALKGANGESHDAEEE